MSTVEDTRLNNMSEKTIRNNIHKQNVKLNGLNKLLADKARTKLNSVEFIKCTNCLSRMNTRFKSQTLRCPICDASFLSKSDLNRRAKLETKIKDLQQKLTDEVNRTSKVIDKDLVVQTIKSLKPKNPKQRYHFMTGSYVSSDYVDFQGTEVYNVGTVTFNFRANKNDGFFYESNKEDDDWPDFIGQKMIDDAMRKAFGKDYQGVQDHEKGYFSVYVKGKL